MPATRVMFTAPGKVAVESFEPADVGANQVRTRAIASVISPGTELAYLHQLENARWPLPGVNNGYCHCAVVEKIGPEVKHLAPGQRVVGLASHASVSVSDAKRWFAVPETLPPAHAAMFALVEICVQAVQKAEIRLGQNVAVLGLGVIGNIAAQLARCAGATQVVGIDPVQFRRDLGKRCGLDAVVESADAAKALREKGFDVVIEATGAAPPIVSAFQLARRMGRVILLGSTRGLTQDVNFYRDVHHKGLTVIGAHAGTRPDVDEWGPYTTLDTDIRTSIDLLAVGRVNVGPLVTETVPYSKAPEAYARLADRSQPVTTIALDWRGADGEVTI
jgi:threonine dehydrogenase-like Zn-dependent dehydrogenase